MASAAAVEGVAGALGGITALVTTYPLITLTTRQQTRLRQAAAAATAASAAKRECEDPVNDQPDSSAESRDGTRASATRPSRPERRDDLYREVRTILYEEGWTRFFAGMKPALFATASSQGVYYFCYSLFRSVLLRWQRGGWKRSDGAGPVAGPKTLSVLSTMLVSSAAGCSNVLVNHPIWLVVTRMQVQHKSFMEVARELSLEPCGARRAFYRGLAPALIMVVNPVVQFVFYEQLVALLLRFRGGSRRNFTAVDLFLAGALAKLAATLLTYPMNLVKSRLQVSGASTGNRQRMVNYRGVWDVIRRIAAAEGLSGFFSGIETKIAQSVFAAALLFMVKGKIAGAARMLLSVYVRKGRAK